MNWIEINWSEVPLEQQVLVKHPFGVEGIHFWNGCWKYWYTGKPCSADFLGTITHYIVVE